MDEIIFVVNGIKYIIRGDRTFMVDEHGNEVPVRAKRSYKVKKKRAPSYNMPTIPAREDSTP